MKVKDKNQKRLVSLENEIEPLSTDQEGKLRGGFSAVSTAAMTSGTGNGTCSGNGTCKSNGVCSSNGTCKNNGECVASNNSSNGNCGCTTTAKPDPVTPAKPDPTTPPWPTF